MSSKTFKNHFSLIELLAVIAVMSMLIAIVGAAMKPNPVNAAARELSGTISKARSYALSKRVYTIVHITKQEDKFSQIEPIKIYTALTPSVIAGSPDTIPGSTTIYLNKGAKLDSGSQEEFYLCFHPNGGILLDTVTDTLTTANGDRIATSDGKYVIDIIKRGKTEELRTLSINKFTGMVSFED
ncbi:hypothetical protein PQO03_20390 [Lentisphaera profundi]|uniref:Prepilin-type N-terminal cleavage/methylation domain-containing protein n=1 Tax=Lentisphaera profundi TaxID=1658616 RepID=A0ABY7VWL8_9BACT|nr:hypothetical protein [Lentisphaera profundi]WDE98179.1 hypothetical protein PQO03_20390 [Lentisphaera profundi]